MMGKMLKFTKMLPAVSSGFTRRIRSTFCEFSLLFLDREQVKWAEKINTYLTAEDKYTLFCLSKSLPDGGVAVEIGSYLGSSSCFLAMGLRKRSGKLYCVDTWQNEAMSEGLRDTFAEFSANIAPFRDVVTPLRGRSEDIGKEFKEKISLLFIDGDHSYQAVARDFFTWLPHLEDPAIVALHDCGWAEGVQRVIAEEIRPRAATWRQTANMAWGRLHKGG